MAIKQYNIGDKIGGELSVLKVFGGTGKTGMGVVYLVDDRTAPFPYVLKTFQHKPGTDASKQFIAEGHAWIQAGVHENIVKALWVREIDSQLFIAAEFIDYDDEGRNTITPFIRAGKLLRIEVIINWAAQFCYGMSYAMQKGVLCHRDIKPDNLMISPDRVLKVTDFGLAKTVLLESEKDIENKGWWPFGKKKSTSTETARQTQVGLTFGTPLYMAPEQFYNAQGVDCRADIYSFGIVLYEMISGGKYPYSQVAIAPQDAIMQFAKLHMSAKPIQLDSPLMPVIDRCLEKRRESRYASYEDLLKDIYKVASSLNVKVAPPPDIGSSEDEELYVKAQSYVALKEPDKALEAIDSYVDKFPKNFWGWTQKSKIHCERSEPKQAIEAAEQSLEIFPYNSPAWNNLGVALKKSGQYSEKLKNAYKNALEYDPENTGAMMNLAIALQDMSEWEQIPSLLLTALELTPEKDLLRFNAGNIAARMVEEKKTAEARLVLEELVKADSDNKNAWHNLALINWQEDQQPEAIKCFENVVRIDSKDAFAWLSLAKLYFSNRKAKETVNCCNQLIKMGKSITPAISMAAQVLNYSGNYHGAIQLLEKNLNMQPMNDTWWFILSEIHEYQDNTKAAYNAALQCKKILQKSHTNENINNIQLVELKIKKLSDKAGSKEF